MSTDLRRLYLILAFIVLANGYGGFNTSPQVKLSKIVIQSELAKALNVALVISNDLLLPSDSLKGGEEN